MTDGEVELVELLKITDSRLVKHIVITKDISLADVALTEAIQDRRRDNLHAIRNGVDEVLSPARELVSVVSVFESQAVARREYPAIRRDFEGVRHRRRELRRFTLMTIGADFVADVTYAVRIGIRPPL